MQKMFQHPSEACTPMQPARQINRSDPWQPSIVCPQLCNQQAGQVPWFGWEECLLKDTSIFLFGVVLQLGLTNLKFKIVFK